MVLGLLAARASWAAPAPAADAEPCKLQTERDRIVDDYAASIRAQVRAPGRPPRPAGAWIWATIPYQQHCVDLAMRWLVDPQSADNRVAAAAWLWQHRELTERGSVHVPMVSDVFGRLKVATTSWRDLPVTPEVRRRWIENAANEPHPIVLRLQLVYLDHGGFHADARALIRAGLATVPREVALAEVVLAHLARRGAPPLTLAERDLVWRMRHGGLKQPARFVLSRMRDPEWVTELEAILRRPGDKEELYEPAALAGLAARFAPAVLAEARAAVARENGNCLPLRDHARRFTGAAAETLALAGVFLSCRDRLRDPWPGLVRAASLAPDGDQALVRLARLQRQHGEPHFWRYAGELVAALVAQGTDESVEGLLEVAHMCQGYGADGPMLWRLVDAMVEGLRAVGSPRAGDGLVRLARLAAGPCESDGRSCLWRVGKRLRAAVKAVGGPAQKRRLRELAKVRPLPRGKQPPRWTPPPETATPSAPAAPAAPAAPVSGPSPRRSSGGSP